VYTEIHHGRIVALGADGKEVWALQGLDGPADIQFLPSGRLLIAENYGSKVTERDRRGRVVWQLKTAGYPVSCWRLDTGNTVVATNRGLLEVTPEGKTVWSKQMKGVYCARRLRGGSVAVLCGPEEPLVILSSTGRVLRRIELEGFLEGIERLWPSLTILANGNFLIAGWAKATEVVEVTPQGREVWSCSRFKVRGAVRLPNGNTLLADRNEKALVEINKAGMVVRQHKTTGRPWHVQILP
jgi:hypothetical protein